jgi:hypothetical protein
VQTHSPFQPGDVVRDRDTQVDYIVENISAALGVGYISWKLIGVLNDHIQEIQTKSDDEFEQGYLRLVANTARREPQLILQELRQDMEKVLGRDKIIESQINQPENAVLRDLLYVARSADEENFDRGLVELAENLVYGIQGKPSKSVIRQILLDTGSNMENEFLEDLVHRIDAQTTNIATRGGYRRIVDGSMYHDFRQFMTDEFSLAREAGLTNQRRAFSELPTLTGLERELLGKVLKDREFGEQDYGWPELSQTAKGLDRTLLVAREMFKELTGRPMSKTFEATIRAQHREAREMLERGRETPLAQMLLKTSKVNEAKASSLTRPGKWSKFGGIFNRTARGERMLRSGPFQYLRGIRPRTTGLRHARELSVFRPGFNWRSLIDGKHFSSHRDTNKVRVYSVDRNTFINDLLGRNRFELQNQTMSLTDVGALDTLKAGLQHDSVLLPLPKLQELIKQRETGDVMKLDEILHTSSRLQQSLQHDARETLLAEHGVNQTGQRVLEVFMDREQFKRALSPGHAQGLSEYAQTIPTVEGKHRVWVMDTHDGQTIAGDLHRLVESVESGRFKLGGRGLQYTDIEHPIHDLTRIQKGSGTFHPLIDSPTSITTIEDYKKLVGSFPVISSLEARHIEQGAGKAQVIEAVQAQRLAVAQIRNPNTTSELKMLATNLRSTTIEDQLQLVRNFYGGRSMILDIETAPINGRWQTTEVAGILHTGEQFAASKFTNNTQRADAIIGLARHVAQVDVVASHTAYDPDQLISEARLLIHSLSPTKQIELTEAIKELENARNTKWLDLTVLHQLRPGGAANQVNQQLLAMKHLTGLDRIERHTAISDSEQAWKLARQAQPEVLEALNNIQLSAEHQAHPLLMLETDPRGMRFGRVVGIEGYKELQEFGGKPGGAAALVREYSPQQVNGQWVFKPMPLAYEEQAESVHALVGMLSRSGTVVNSENWATHRPIWEHAMDELSGRELRHLFQVRNFRPWDTAGGLRPEIAMDIGPLSLIQYRARYEALNNIGEIQNIARGLRDAAITSVEQRTGAAYKPAAEDFLAAAVHKWSGTMELPGKLPESRAYYRHTLEGEMLDMLQSGGRPALTGNTAHGRLMNSEVGSFLYSTIKQAQNGEQPFLPQGILLHAEEMAIERFGQNMKPKSFGYRLGGELAGTRVSFKLGRFTHQDIHQAADTLGSWGADMLLELNRETDGAGEATKFFGRMGWSPERMAEIRQTVQEVRDIHGVEHWNVEGWKRLMTSMSPDQSPQERLLAQAMNELQTSPRGLYGALTELISKRQAGMIQADGQHHALIEEGDRLLQHLEQARNQGLTKAQDIFRLGFTTFAEERGEQGTRFLEDMGRDMNEVLGHIADFNGQDLAEIVKRTQQTMAEHQGVVEEEQAWELAMDAAKGLQGFEATGAMLSSLRGHDQALPQTVKTTNENLEREATHRAMKAGQLTAQDVSSRTEREIMQEVINNFRTTKVFAGLRVPLLAVGGVLGLLAAVAPHDDHFSQGQRSDRMDFTQPYAARYAEIPGNSRIQRAWAGDPSPWQLDITFEGFVQHQRQHEDLMRQVYDAINGEVDVRANHTQIDDLRSTDHRMSSRELIRRI